MKKRTIVIMFLMGYGMIAQTFNKQKLDSLFNLIETNNKGMGSISIFHEGKEVYQNCIGYADVENNREASKNTKYRIGSITKTYTATMIMQLVDEKKITLTTTIDTYFPLVPNADKITIGHLLKHRSGLYNITDDVDFVNWMVLPQTRNQMIARVIKSESQFTPNSKTEYSNTNYLLLSYIIEDIEKKTYAQVLQSKIVKPCRLRNTYYGSKIDTKNNEALSYELEDKWNPSIETDMSVPLGAGGIVSTSSDVNAFYDHLFEGKLISREALNKMKIIDGGLGMGLMMLPFQDKKVYGHHGKIDGFQSLSGYFINEKIGITYIANGVVLPIESIVLGALQIYSGEDYKLPDFKPTAKLKEAQLKSYFGVYSSPNFPLVIEIIQKDGVLLAQATGKPLLPLEPVGENKFKSDRAMLTLRFVPEEDKMFFERGNQKQVLVRKPKEQ
ncbi:serine hydrolase domain-containing protein [Aquimarina sp. 2201CG1-2-11]|uniref:serine hydrolase domain-containing protein n=1 Tax=Aquimarina discodermiae TaxID=3231043 RepID=UPI0034636664